MCWENLNKTYKNALFQESWFSLESTAYSGCTRPKTQAEVCLFPEKCQVEMQEFEPEIFCIRKSWIHQNNSLASPFLLQFKIVPPDAVSGWTASPQKSIRKDLAKSTSPFGPCEPSTESNPRHMLYHWAMPPIPIRTMGYHTIIMVLKGEMSVSSTLLIRKGFSV